MCEQDRIKQLEGEIERLQSENDWLRTALRAAQIGQAHSDAEPVAWLIHDPNGFKFATVDKLGSHKYCAKHPTYRIEPLYTAPPRPDASAGLIEAAELLESEARIELAINRRCELHRAASFLRSRAADRSAK